MAAPRIIDTARTSSVILGADDSDVTVNASITLPDSLPSGIGIDVAVGAGGLIDVASSITAEYGIAALATQANAYNVAIRPGAAVTARSLGIALVQTTSTVLNEGEIRAELGTGILLSGSGLHSITNSGLVSGLTGIEFRKSVTGAGVVNTGTITARDAAVRFTVGSNSLTNDGTIITTGEFGKSIVGGANSETIVNNGSVVGLIDLGSGEDLLDNRNGTIMGLIGLGSGNDTFLGGASDETIEEGYGGGDDSIDGGGGNDTVSYEYALGISITVDLRTAAAQNTGLGMNILHGVENIIGGNRADILIGDDFGNRLSGRDGGDNLSGGIGNDSLEGGSGNDLLDGGDGNDTAVFSGAENVVVDLSVFATQTTGYGEDRLAGIENVTGGDGNDRLTGSILANVLLGGNGDDRLKGAAGNDTLEGGDGSDILNGGTDDDLIEGGGDEDVLYGDSGDDMLLGGAGGDLLTGGGGDDTLDGGSGNDTIIGSGRDVAVYSVKSSDAVPTRNPDGTLVVASADGTDELQGIRFGKFSDRTVAFVNEAPDFITLSKTAVAENVLTSSIVAQIGARDADGDAITYSLIDSGNGTFALSGGDKLVLARALNYEARAQYSVSVKAEDAWGGVTIKDFTITVDAVPKAPSAGQPLILTGTSGADTLTGKDLNDVLTGSAGDDVLSGNGGNDILSGGSGKDVLVGGAGQDIFVFDVRPRKTAVDRIQDFSVVDDTIHLARSAFAKIANKGVLADKAFWVGDKAHDASDRVIYNKKTGVLSYDSDGTGKTAAVQIAVLSPKLLLKTTDFFVV